MSASPEYPRLAEPAARDLFARILDRCRRPEGAPTPVVVLDLDGTLMDNRPRTAAILRDLAERWAERHPQASERLRRCDPNELVYLLSDSLRKLGVVESALVAEASDYWRGRFFTDDDLRHDVALEGAVDFVRACHDRGATVVYLTGRDLPMMGLGTFSSLRTLGFPIGVAGVEIILKPDAQMADEAFKRMVAPTLARVGEVVASFDNEPANCNLFHEAYPRAEIVFVDTQHVPGAPALRPEVSVVADFSGANSLVAHGGPREGEP
jgi:beta-phosphoglucomutase-like phosphatase (HAD superfamily)